jgi:AraC-like DNA-binding protein
VVGTLIHTKIGLDSGFTDHSVFSRAFRRHVGISPDDYRLLKPGGG